MIRSNLHISPLTYHDFRPILTIFSVVNQNLTTFILNLALKWKFFIQLYITSKASPLLNVWRSKISNRLMADTGKPLLNLRTLYNWIKPAKHRPFCMFGDWKSQRGLYRVTFAYSTIFIQLNRITKASPLLNVWRWKTLK